MKTLVPAMALACAALHAQPAAPLALREHWAIQSSALVADTGDAISRPGYKTTGWYPATMPSTVVAALVKEHVYPDPGFGMNLRAFAGTSYPIGVNFSNIHMPPDSPYRVPWWFRTEFQAPPQHNEPKEQKGETLWLRFDGINYRANVWLNGKRIADSGSMAGAWRLFEYNVTEAIRPGAANALAVEVSAPLPDDLAITFVDWNPGMPDKGMGLWRDVHLDATGPVASKCTSRQRPMSLSGMPGFQSTKVMERSSGSGAYTSTASALAAPGRMASVTLNSNKRHAPAMLPESAMRLPFSHTLAR